ncbi:DNA phosphorothioation-dependent restriction protein DptF [Neobacillus drentensis]|uniref:DNA phosphorothioation-dependent restriction protein DptF n=1 Tax=Neobacillus drentensis TaxID=220684 RepID=UPI001F2EFC4C|nr:DNA phosphorothioation-dependent restriction protein DptF [Neobacillus drentensis]ULT59606.1 DNA phosphorothioation-dependent restriction protein DptF [Neobacillus drentensis]
MEQTYKCLISELARLKQSSKEAVENIEDFNNFKKYMHVERPYEKELKVILEEIKTQEKPHLVLVCGSVGDGKSHLISYLRAEHQELFSNIKIHNDATESFSPNETSIDTLRKQLVNFSDNALISNTIIEGQHLVIAINLGTLSNFLNSKYQNEFTKLKKFVHEHKIIDEEQSDYENNYSLPFRFINLSDYHLYELTSEGVQSSLQEKLLKKISENNENNPFFRTYSSHCQSNCPVSDTCPVKKNYELLFNQRVRSVIIKQLAELNIKYKVIISTRTYFDFIYHILVDDQLDLISNSNKITEIIGEFKQADFLSALLPNRFYDYSEKTELFREIKKFEPGTNRSDKLDQLIITFFNTDNLMEIFKDYLSQEIIEEFNLKQMLNTGISLELKKQLFTTLIRTNKFIPLNEENEIMNEDTVYEKFVKYLFSWNINDIRNIRHLYQDVIKSIYLWNGFAEKGSINIFLGKNQVKFRISETLNLISHFNVKEIKSEDKLERFLTNMTMEFEIENKDVFHSLNIDYHLFNLIQKIKDGYSPNSQDKNNFVSFVDFIQKVIKDGSQKKSIQIRNKVGKKIKEYKLSVDQFGYYEFKENS